MEQSIVTNGDVDTMRTIKKVEQPIPKLRTRKKVAAYARVSMESERMNHSLSAQVSYYNFLIQRTPDWEFAGVYADDGISGTGIEKRLEFQRMVSDAEKGMIDIILTKSIQRFARNTVDLLNTVRHLKDIGVEVRFEKENISSFTGDGELMLSILASFAQEESRSISENCKWSIKKGFEKGIPHGHFQIYGYRWDGDHLVVEPKEAEIVKMIYHDYLRGAAVEDIERKLKKMEVKAYKGGAFGSGSIRNILRNITYTGNLLFQKEFKADPISGRSKMNRGELPQYWVEDSHEAIIPMETFKRAEAERLRRRELGVYPNINTTCFTRKIKCGNCGVNYRRKSQKKERGEIYYVWICQTYDKKGKDACTSKAVPEDVLKDSAREVLKLDEFDESVFLKRVSHITVIGKDTLVFHLTDGNTVTRTWKVNGLVDAWTPERRKEWGERQRNKCTNPIRHNEFTAFIKCGKCGANYRVLTYHCIDGTNSKVWRCPGKCEHSKIKDETMRKLVYDVLGLTDFSEETMDAEIEEAVISDNTVTFHFRDGHTEILNYKDKKKGHPHTEEFKTAMRARRRNESHNNTSNN